MNRRTWAAAILAVLAVATISEVVATMQPAGVARADVCASVGRRVRVGGCANLADAVAPYVPPPTYYAPLPEDYPPPPPPP